jgi:hypothetical protein
MTFNERNNHNIGEECSMKTNNQHIEEGWSIKPDVSTYKDVQSIHIIIYKRTFNKKK